MSHSKNYDNNKNKVQSKSKSNLVEDLNEMLSVENASIDRIISRIGGKPTYTKADLSRLAPPATIIMKKRSITTAESKKEDNVRDNSIPEEEELVRPTYKVYTLNT